MLAIKFSDGVSLSPHWRAFWFWGLVAAISAAIGVAGTLTAPLEPITLKFFFLQDLPILAASVFLIPLCLAFGSTRQERAVRANQKWILAIAAALLLSGWLGSRWIYEGYPLSLDEFMVNFDATIMSSGRLKAALPSEWRPYELALQPLFILETSGRLDWVSVYLPVNAALHALAMKIGLKSLLDPMLAAISVLCTYDIARRLWPERSNAGLFAGVLLASSPQVIATSMTTYSMTGHLALNSLWLWLVIRGGRWGNGLAPGVSFLAAGLHQWVFHPMFAGPFVLEMWLARRWWQALFHTVAFALILAFWATYQPLILHSAGSDGGLVHHIMGLLGAHHVSDITISAMNLVRFLTWQNLLVIPFYLIALRPAYRVGGYTRALAIGPVLAFVALTSILPFQGHGWGYRYLHGFLGSVALVAAWRLCASGDGLGESATPRLIFGATVITTLVLLPIRLWQVQRFVHPYAAAERSIRAAKTDVVLVDESGVWYGIDLVRNDPFLRAPIVFRLAGLSAPQVQQLCANRTVSLFDRTNAARAGIQTGTSASSPHISELRNQLVQSHCLSNPSPRLPDAK